MTQLEIWLTFSLLFTFVAWYFTIEYLVHCRSQWKHWEDIAREFKDYVVHQGASLEISKED